MRGEPLRGAADHLVGLAAARDQRRQLAFERAGLLMRAEPGLLHRRGNRARLLLGARQIVQQHADIDLGGVGGRFRALPISCRA